MADYLDFEKVDYLDDEILVYEKRVYDIGRCIKLPFEDVAPVVHAHWEMYRDETNCTYGNYACTNCHTIQGLMKYRYCPYCGAKMDEEMSK